MERYGVELTRADPWTMEDAIRAGRSVLVRTHPGGEVHMISHLATVFLAVFGSVGKIVTFLPPDALTVRNSRARRREKWGGPPVSTKQRAKWKPWRRGFRGR